MWPHSGLRGTGNLSRPLTTHRIIKPLPPAPLQNNADLKLHALAGSPLSTGANGSTLPEASGPAFTIFGVPKGTCPPGTAVYESWRQTVLGAADGIPSRLSVADLSRAALGADLRVVVPEVANATSGANATLSVPLTGRVHSNASSNASEVMIAGIMDSAWATAFVCAESSQVRGERGLGGGA